MPASRRPSLPLLCLACLLGCRDVPEGAPSDADRVAASPGPGWAADLQRRLAAGSAGFVRRGAGWEASLQGMSLRGETGATRLRFGEDRATVRTTGVGRGSRLRSARLGAPELGACEPGREDPSGACVRRLETTGEGLVEWWASTDAGFEQGWTVDQAPAGAGDLTLALAVEGAAVETAQDEVRLRGRAGGSLRLSALDAHDARGEPLRAWFEPAERGFQVRVDDRGARYPIEIDPIYTDAAWTLEGSYWQTHPEYAYSLANAGDVNGDGYADLVVGAYAYQGYCGAAFVYEGSATGLSTTASATLQNCDGRGIQMGWAVAGPGDLDGDGYDDIAVGANYDGDPGTYAGSVTIFHGGPTGVSETVGEILPGTTKACFGAVLASAGDVNGDGYADLLVGSDLGCGGDSTNAGNFSLFYGSDAGLSPTDSTTVTGSAAKQRLGVSMAGLGDIDGDGYDDIVVGATGYGLHGAVLIYPGSAAGLGTTATVIEGTDSQKFGRSVAAVGDVDGDGHGDLLVGQPNDRYAWLFPGTGAGFDATAVTSLKDPVSTNDFGSALAGVGDVNGDGYADVLVGNYDYTSSKGQAYLYLGSSSGLATSPSVTWDGGSKDDYGFSVAALGDENGDGYDDLAIGAPGLAGGRVDIFDGSASGPGSAADRSLDHPPFNTLVGWSVRGAGDVNGDGYDDLLVGAYGIDEVFVYLGSPDGPLDTPTTLAEGALTDAFGVSLASADVNGDGYDDVIVGAPEAATAYLFLGSADGVSTTAAATLTGDDDSEFADTLASAGDVNGDGYEDVVIGAYHTGYDEDADMGNGAVYVFEGSASGLSTSPATTIAGTSLSNFGWAVAGAGDVDGDGYDDIAVGSPDYRHTGLVTVYLGSSSGISSTPATSLTGALSDELGSAIAGVGDVNGVATTTSSPPVPTRPSPWASRTSTWAPPRASAPRPT